MYKRLIILSVIILLALCGLVWLGYHSIQIQAQGLEGVRLGEFAAVAEQIRQDVKRKLDEFVQTEQNRPYTDYLYYYVPENVVSSQQQLPLLRSPLAGRLEHGLAYGNFQIEPDGNITTPNDDIKQGELNLDDKLYAEALANRANIRNNLLPLLSGKITGSNKLNIYRQVEASPEPQPKVTDQVESTWNEGLKMKSEERKVAQSQYGRALSIESLQEQAQKTQVMPQKRSVVEQNIFSNAASRAGRAPLPQDNQSDTQFRDQPEPPLTQAPQQNISQPLSERERQNDMVQVRIGPFETIVAGGDNTEESIFGGQVFLVRHVQIEDKYFWQGFQLNEKKLIEEVKESASKFVREGMSFELAPTKTADAAHDATENGDIAYSAVLDFLFGDLVLNLKETNPDWIGKEISHLRNWYFSIISVVLLAAGLGLAGLWRSARAQIKLAEKKDDFISAVSHELRTPLTSIRMYTEMLEKNWVKSEDKLAEYYRNMRQESERLSRLIENVLDFSRIQRGRKKYTFKIGDVNKCIEDVIKMIRPYASQRGFSIKTELGHAGKIAFDADAVTQIVVNLLDNAVKYARDTEDKTVTIRTRTEKQFILIEVEDHGPGVPHQQRKKIFEQFYRSEAEATRDTVGTGLGLALVKKFAQAHNGFVEIVSAKPTGAIFRVALAIRV
jgi:signal transduction histidine kinase